MQGLFDPLSPAGTSALAGLLSAASLTALGRDVTKNAGDTIAFAVAGRLLLNVSNTMSLVPKAAIESFIGSLDGLAGRAIAAADEATYRGPWTRSESLALLLRKAPPKVARVASSVRDPQRALESAHATFASTVQALRARRDDPRPVDVVRDEVLRMGAGTVFADLLPRFIASKVAMGAIRKLFPSPSPETAKHIAALDTGLSGNVTVEMGLALEAAAALLPDDIGDDDLVARVARGEAPAAFQAAWRAFIDRYGHRGPRELDIAAPRFREDPRMLLHQAVQQRRRVAPSTETPRAAATRARREAVAALTQETRGPLRRAAFKHLARVIELLGGLRESPKFVLITALDVIRTQMLRAGAQLVRDGRLDAVDHVWNLEIGDVAAGQRDPTIDLRARGARRREAQRSLERARELPRVFDSRGRIFRAPNPQAKEGELSGQPISNGVVRGPCKVLRTADEKPLLPGDILVARATDPGWTPLFVNAAGVVLEVGGLMQHGALVAREYGKPCVAGVVGATESLRDGMYVELDGTAGIVRLNVVAEAPR